MRFIVEEEMKRGQSEGRRETIPNSKRVAIDAECTLCIVFDR